MSLLNAVSMPAMALNWVYAETIASWCRTTGFITGSVPGDQDEDGQYWSKLWCMMRLPGEDKYQVYIW